MTETELPRSRDDAIRAENAGVRLEFLCFWGHRPSADGEVGPGCLSQWWPAPFTVDGETFATAEHYMMAHKAWLFDDDEIARRVLDTPQPREAKRLGRRIRDYDDTVWAEHRYSVVVAGSIAKFAAHPELRDYLLASRSRVLVEASPIDRIWGIGLVGDDDRARQPSAWRGLNLLGFALMDARAALAASS